MEQVIFFDLVEIFIDSEIDGSIFVVDFDMLGIIQKDKIVEIYEENEVVFGIQLGGIEVEVVFVQKERFLVFFSFVFQEEIKE